MKSVSPSSLLLSAAAALVIAAPASAELKTPRPSPVATVTQMIGLTEAKLAYSRPAVKGRVIWGGRRAKDRMINASFIAD